MLSVIICTYNRARYLIPLLESVADNTLPKNEYEILLVDNNSTDNTYETCMQFVRLFPDVNFRYTIEKEQGLSAARNYGIRESKGELLLYLDDDAVVNDNFLKAYVDWFGCHNETMAAGGPIEPLYEDCSEPEWMSPYTRALLTGWMNCGDKIREFPKGKYPVGCNAVFRREVFDIIGYFNAGLGRKGNSLMGGEEKDIFDKMKSHHMQIIYLPTPVLYHKIPAKKLGKDYFDRLTLQIGQSERVRTKDIGTFKFIKRLFSELIKWGGTLILFIVYTIRMSPSKGIKIVLFRRNVTKGLLGMQ